VGHTGDPKATVVGCETVDKAVKVQCTTIRYIHACFLDRSDFSFLPGFATRHFRTIDVLRHDTTFPPRFQA
jgi:hypothetical protein